MTLYTVIASSDRAQSDLVCVSDSFVPDCDFWLGDYPYLNKKELLNLISTPTRPSSSRSSGRRRGDDSRSSTSTESVGDYTSSRSRTKKKISKDSVDIDCDDVVSEIDPVSDNTYSLS